MAKLFTFTNSGDPDQTPHSAASDLGMHCLPVTLLWSPDYNELISIFYSFQHILFISAYFIHFIFYLFQHIFIHLSIFYLFSDATLELEDKYKRTVDEIEALKDHLGMARC